MEGTVTNEDLPVDPRNPDLTIVLSLDVYRNEPVGGEVPQWYSTALWPDGSTFDEELPSFADAAVGVSWWRSKGVSSIRVSFRFFDDEHYWAGDGAPPIDPQTGTELPTFSPDDPRGRATGAQETARQLQDAWQTDWSNQMLELERALGARLKDRRTALGLTAEHVAERAGTQTTLVRLVEQGNAGRLAPRQWLPLVWATSARWIEGSTVLSSALEKGREIRGWLNVDELTLAERLIDRAILEELD